MLKVNLMPKKQKRPFIIPIQIRVPVRIILTILLLAGVYSETGIFTTLFCSLIAAGAELGGWMVIRELRRKVLT